MDSGTKHLASPVRETLGTGVPAPAGAAQTRSLDGDEDAVCALLPGLCPDSLPRERPLPPERPRPGPSMHTAGGGGGVQAAWALLTHMVPHPCAQGRADPVRAGRTEAPAARVGPTSRSSQVQRLLRAPRRCGFAPSDTEAEDSWPRNRAHTRMCPCGPHGMMASTWHLKGQAAVPVPPRPHL